MTFVHVIYSKITKKKLRTNYYGGKRVISQNNANEIIKQKIRHNQPFLFGRNGTNEDFIAGLGYMKSRDIIDSIHVRPMENAFQHCGLFPCTDDTAEKFSQLIYKATMECDMYGTLYAILGSYTVREHLRDNVILTAANTMDFWRYEEPFTYELRGKKVLVVHSFADQIEEQYKKRDRLFTNPKVLPEFELITFKAVQTIAGTKDSRFETWFDALDYMVKEVSKIDFDIALLGCGAYGMPLAAEIKRMGKQAIYMGGVLQMLFGIYGSRWDAEPSARALKNEYWVRPNEKNIPENARSVEGGCYW